MKIYCISHKLFYLPTDDPIYVPLYVGDIRWVDGTNGEYLHDDTGDNISERNPSLNELTGIYWIWKNTREDIVGICHYRRYFTNVTGKLCNLVSGHIPKPLGKQVILRMLRNHDIVVHNRTYLPQTNREQLKSVVTERELDIANDIIRKMAPDDYEIYQDIMESHSAHLLNMMICRREVFEGYCEWLFPTVLTLDDELKKESNKYNNKRTAGYIGERMLDVYIRKSGLKVRECLSVNTESIDWRIWANGNRDLIKSGYERR